MSWAIIPVGPPYSTGIDKKHIHELDGLAKKSLFQHAKPAPQQEHNKASDILSRLEGLSPSLAKDFKYRDDSMDDIPFRLLNPHAERLVPEESYVAVSYCWAKNITQVTPEGGMVQQNLTSTHQDTSDTIDHPLPFSPLLYQALLSECNSPREGIWIDNVCINQQDPSEKAKAINAMHLVYESARSTIAVLDDIEISRAEYEIFQTYLPIYESSVDKSLHYVHTSEAMAQIKVVQDFAVKLLQARWFSRAWCNHEARLSHNLTLLIRCDLPDQPSVVRLTNAVIPFLVLTGLKSAVLEQRVPPYASRAIRVLLYFSRTAESPRDHINSLMGTFSDVFTLGAGGNPALPEDKRELDGNLDKLHIAVNTTGIGLSYIRAAHICDEKILPTMDECCRKFTLLALAARDPMALCTSGRLMCSSGGVRSWLNWPSALDIDGLYRSPRLLSDSAVRAISLDTSPTAEYISLDLMILDNQNDRRGPSEIFLQRAQDVLEVCTEQGMEISSLPTGYMDHGRGFSNPNTSEEFDRGQAKKNLHLRCLACVVECGSYWAKCVVENFDDGFCDINVLKTGVEALTDDNFLSFIQQGESHSTLKTVLHFVGEIIRKAVPWNTTEHSWMMWQPRLIRSVGHEAGGCGTLLIFDHPELQLLTAVPTSLAHAQFERFFCGWSIVSLSDPSFQGDEYVRIETLRGYTGSAYCLIAKTRVYGRIDLNDECLTYGTISKGARVYGLPSRKE